PLHAVAGRRPLLLRADLLPATRTPQPAGPAVRDEGRPGQAAARHRPASARPYRSQVRHGSSPDPGARRLRLKDSKHGRSHSFLTRHRSKSASAAQKTASVKAPLTPDPATTHTASLPSSRGRIKPNVRVSAGG